METPTSAGPGNAHWWLLPLLAVVALIVVLVGIVAALFATTSSNGYDWMMSGNGAWGWMWAAGALMMMIPLVVLVLLITVLVHSGSSYPAVLPAGPAQDPLSEVRLRYARGEITRNQYSQILRDLRANP